jgi:hypothetical protein
MDWKGAANKDAAALQAHDTGNWNDAPPDIDHLPHQRLMHRLRRRKLTSLNPRHGNSSNTSYAWRNCRCRCDLVTGNAQARPVAPREARGVAETSRKGSRAVQIENEQRGLSERVQSLILRCLLVHLFDLLLDLSEVEGFRCLQRRIGHV